MNDEQTICALTGDPELPRVGLPGYPCYDRRAEPDHNYHRKPSHYTNHVYLLEFQTQTPYSQGEVRRKCKKGTDSGSIFGLARANRAWMRHREVQAVVEG